jgi:hypothetical protein
MTTNNISDDTIEAAINQHGDLDHEDALTVDEVRDILAIINQNLVDYYSEWIDVIDDGDTAEIVHEDKRVIVIADHSGFAWNQEFDEAGVDDDITKSVIKGVHHEAAADLTDFNWSVSDPIVVQKPDEWRTVEQHVRRSIAKLVRESGSVARGVDRWATERQDLTLKEWGDAETGTDRPHQVVSKNARRGREAAERQSE